MGEPGSRRRRVGRWAVLASAVLAIAGVVGPSVWTRVSTDGRRYGAVGDVPGSDVALVLGAGVLPGGRPSAFLARRLDLAVALYERGTVRAVLVSGDHGTTSYDEVTPMGDYLVARGVPADRVVRDHAGFETWDSCVRAREVFGVHRAVVVTQAFHLPRAVALCRRAGIDAVGLGDDSAAGYPARTRRSQVREVLATMKAAVTAVLRPDPRFLGPREPGVDRALAAEPASR